MGQCTLCAGVYTTLVQLQLKRGNNAHEGATWDRDVGGYDEDEESVTDEGQDAANLDEEAAVPNQRSMPVHGQASLGPLQQASAVTSPAEQGSQKSRVPFLTKVRHTVQLGHLIHLLQHLPSCSLTHVDCLLVNPTISNNQHQL